jgi:ATP-dependent helicase HrpB
VACACRIESTEGIPASAFVAIVAGTSVFVKGHYICRTMTPLDRAPALPIDDAISPLRLALRSHRAAVLRAPPGAGKTTRVPLALLDEPWLAGRRIVMLEPRRLAARAAAAHMAWLLGEQVGGTVGYRVRLDTRVGARTRIEVVTEGILTRLIEDDPALDGTGLVIFDEFHERSVHADLGLALTLQTRELLREDLALLVMSATLDTAPVAALLGDAPVIASEGRSFPVETRYVARRPQSRVEPQVAATVRDALARDAGDVLVFLPGAAEIRRVAALLDDVRRDASLSVIALHGMLPLADQDRAIAPSPRGRRKIVLATAIAETSLTIEGVRVVIDAGLMRVPRFSPRSGMTRLDTIRVSRASADQRRGRAGRVAAGVCYRLWSEHEEGHLVDATSPEILETDLAPLALTLADAAIADPSMLRWLDPPPAAAFAHARELLGQLGALDAGGRISEHGRGMARLAMHPRLAHMVLAAIPMGYGALACDIAALLGERDILRGEGAMPDADLRLRLEALRARGDRATRSMGHGATVDLDALSRVRRQARQWRAQLEVRDSGAADDIAMTGTLLARAYPDRVAQRRDDGGRFLLRSGRGAALASPQTPSSMTGAPRAGSSSRRRWRSMTSRAASAIRSSARRSSNGMP